MTGLLTSTLLCTTCFGSPSEAEAAGMQWAVFLLVGLVAVIQVGVAWLLFRVASRSRFAAEEEEVFE